MESLQSDNESVLWRFPSDQHLLLYSFLSLRESGLSNGPLYTSPIDISDNGIHSSYRKKGVGMSCSFVQATPTSRILRLDVPYLIDEGADEERTIQAVKEVLGWILPGLELPLPIHLADEKCRIREGCAEVLFDEILTRSMSTDRFSQLASLSMR